MTEFAFKTEPFLHQLQEFHHARDLPFRAQLWEQGTAKTKVIIDTGAHLYLQGKINTVLVVAPNGVDENWTTDQIPEHMPAAVEDASMVVLYRPEKRQTKWHLSEMRRAIYHNGLLWLCVPYDAFISKNSKKFIWEVLSRRKCLYTLDESSCIKTPSAKRTISIIASGVYAPYRRILEGTPVSNSPFDIYSQVRFLDRDFWARELEINTAVEFRQYFGVWRKRGNETSAFDMGVCIAYRRLDQLQACLKKLGSRILKSEVLPDLPPKLFAKRYFDLSPVQSRVYSQLKEDFMAVLDSGNVVTAPLAITQLLRLQQVTCGYVPVDAIDGDPQPTELLGPTNPRLDLMAEAAEATPHQAIIWARFRMDIDLITKMLGPKATRYDGQVDQADRQRNKEAFLAGDKQFMVANQAAMSRGHTFINALSTFYYSNSFKLTERLQSEDRNHRAGQHNSVEYTDLLASGTVDLRIVRNLRNKVDIASQVTGDELREWI